MLKQSQNVRNLKDYRDSWYALTANRLIQTLGPLKDEVNCDVCIVGAGFTGLSAALELQTKGLSVIILEKNTLASGASGKNGGHIIRGLPKGPAYTIDKFGLDDAKLVNNLTLEGIALILDRIRAYDIDCDLHFGHLTAAVKPRHVTEFKDEIAAWQKLGHDDFSLLEKDETQELVRTPKYIGGLFDPKGAHFHPLNYALGIAAAFISMGGKIYENTNAHALDGTTVHAGTGMVKAKHVILAGTSALAGGESIGARAIDVAAHMISTESIGEQRARALMPKNIAVMDANFIMSYYRFTPDHRILFGGNCNYSNREFDNEDSVLRGMMLDVFPQLRATAIEHCWTGPLNMTLNRLPQVGELSPGVYYTQGFSGHGIVTSNILGKVLAEAIMGVAGARFDVFARIRHAPLPGGDLLKRPLFMLGMIWYLLRDKL